MIVKRKKGIVAKRGPMSTAQQVLYTYFERKKTDEKIVLFLYISLRRTEEG